MPNHKLSNSLMIVMTIQAMSLCRRRINMARTGFPLPLDKIQQAVLPVKWRDVVLEMLADGGLDPNTDYVTLVAATPGIIRESFISIHISHHGGAYNRGIFISGNCNDNDISMYEFRRGTHHKSALDMSVFSKEELDELATWTNNMVKELRYMNLVETTIKHFLVGHAPTVAHVVARWPALTMLVQENIWRSRFANPPRSLKRYGWDDKNVGGYDIHGHPADRVWHDKNQKAMQLTEMILTGAAMLPEDKVADPSVGVTATVETWHPLPSDVDKPI